MSLDLQADEPAAQLGRVQPLQLIEAAIEPIPKDWPARPGALIVVCGGRDYADSAHVDSVLDRLQPRAVVHGACGVDADRPRWARLRGADRLADAWCARRHVPVIRVPARWSALGRRAGAIRNQQMLDLYHPALVVAFPGHLGTADLVLRARAAGVPVWKPAARQAPSAASFSPHRAAGYRGYCSLDHWRSASPSAATRPSNGRCSNGAGELAFLSARNRRYGRLSGPRALRIKLITLAGAGVPRG